MMDVFAAASVKGKSKHQMPLATELPPKHLNRIKLSTITTL